ncbi:hypothetical protein D7S94_14535 [Burkholderia contaminans]|nr:hypothetical protein [Burkholderia contaminans]
MGRDRGESDGTTEGCAASASPEGGRLAPLPRVAPTPRPRGDLRGNRLYTLLPGRTGRASGHSLYSRRVRHPFRHSSANPLPMQESP